MSDNEKYPKYLMIVDGKKEFHTMIAAAALLDNGYVEVKVGDVVLVDEHGGICDMTDADREKIRVRADVLCCSK
jgi:co-chaperonin GroES (HSP10)